MLPLPPTMTLALHLDPDRSRFLVLFFPVAIVSNTIYHTYTTNESLPFPSKVMHIPVTTTNENTSLR